MAANFDIDASRICCNCQRMIVVCSCSRPPTAFTHFGIYPENDLFNVDFLDIEKVEAQPRGSDLDVTDPLCHKSDQREEFIDVDDFSIENLPSELQHSSTFKWIKNCTPLVVRLAGKSFATGQVCLIPEDEGKTMECDYVHCKHGNTRGRNHVLHGGIGIITNNHVVKNSDEAAMTKVEFFYDNDENQLAVVQELGTGIRTTCAKIDYSLFSCFVHSKNLISMVHELDEKRNSSWLTIPQSIRNFCKDYAIVISHPHGNAKKISIGKVIKRGKFNKLIETFKIWKNIFEICEQKGPQGLERFEAYWHQFPDIDLPYSAIWYSTPTCKGSSGAPVYMGDTVLKNGVEINQAHTHRGVDASRGCKNCFT